MPATLRRSRRRELVLTRSFTKALQDKVRLEQPRTDGKESRTLFIDRTNSHSHALRATTFEASDNNSSMMISRPSMTFSLYHTTSSHVPTHPIHFLPPELLVHVFALGAVGDVTFLVLVSHVCHSWRAIALHARSLWRRVTLGPRSNLHMWKERVRRARSGTLDIILTPEASPEASYDIDTVALQMHLLAPHVSAWRSLDIHFDSYTPYLWNAALGPYCRPASYLWDYRSPNLGDPHSHRAIEAVKLESLTLRYPQNDDPKEFCLFGGFAPRLARVTLEGVRLTWLPALFDNLVFLDYTYHGFTRGPEAINEILSMLQVSSRIRDLRLCIRDKTAITRTLLLQTPRLGDDDVALPFLESLSLRVDNEQTDIPSELMTVVFRLSTPMLKNLSLQDQRDHVVNSADRPCRSFSGLPTCLDALSHRLRETSLNSLIAEGRWIEPSLLLGLASQLPLLKFIKVGDALIPDACWAEGSSERG